MILGMIVWRRRAANVSIAALLSMLAMTSPPAGADEPQNDWRSRVTYKYVVTREELRRFGEPGQRCAGLIHVDFSQIEDAPAKIIMARPVAATADKPAYCEVEGYAWRNTQFKVELPLANWNRKMAVVGRGGMAGSVIDNDFITVRDLVPKGYVFVGHNGGHLSTPPDALWAFNNELAVIDLGVRSAHVATLAAKAVVTHFYGAEPKRSYYHGCSGSGREAMLMTQRWPKLFDGVIAGAPSIASADIFTNIHWFSHSLRDQSSNGLDQRARSILHAAVMSQCDRLDGDQDGILQNPLHCKIDFERIQCSATSGTDCLTSHQIGIAKQIYEGPRRPDGTLITASSAMPGSELAWAPLGPVMDRYVLDFYRYLAFNPSAGNSFEIDVTKLGDYYDRMGVVTALLSARNPDIRRFKDHGGKLLMYYGWNDFLGGARQTVDYYETVERLMGGRAQTEDFYRLFMVPGMGHCFGGVGVHQFDFIDALDKWVEQGAAPEFLTGTHLGPDGTPKFKRDIYPYRTEHDPQGQSKVDDRGGLHLPHAVIPYSDLASAEAKQNYVDFQRGFESLAQRAATWQPKPGESKIQQQRRWLDERLMIPWLDRLRASFAVNIEPNVIGGVQADIVTPASGIREENEHRVLINLHGGGMQVGARYGGQLESVPIASIGGIRVITVDYRMAPEHRYPAATEDVVAVYRELLKRYRPENIGIYGCSAGGALTGDVIAHLITHGLPKPGAIGMFGWGAFGGTGFGDSNYMFTDGKPAMNPGGWSATGSYTEGVNVNNTPVQDPAVQKQFPPSLLISGTRDLALSRTVYTHSRLVDLGVKADLHVWEGAPHCSFAQPVVDARVPETQQAWKVITRFFDEHLGNAAAEARDGRK